VPSYDELDNEVWWVREFEQPALARFNTRLRAFYNLTRSQCGSKGDNRHTSGRHRSRNWDLNSRYCTNRSYGTTDPRDKRGNGDALRATDLGLQGPVLWAACRRVDAAVRVGKLPQLAEWFGTFDGKTVVGWSNGHSSTSDSSHLSHGHLGYWTESAGDEAFFDLLFNVITGDDMSWTERPANSTFTYGELAFGTNVAVWKAVGLLEALAPKLGLDPQELAAITAAARTGAEAGVVAAADELAAAIVAELPETGLTKADVETAVRKVLGSLDGATPQV
jgi:hypothetical protein